MKINIYKRKYKSKIIVNTVLIFTTLVYFFPLWILLNNAFKRVENIRSNPFIITIDTFTLDNIINSFKLMDYTHALMNSLIILIISCVLSVTTGSLAGFAIATVKSKMTNRLYISIVGLIALPFQLAMVPLIFIMKNLHLINNYFGTAVVYTSVALPIVIFLYVGYMRTIPKELSEAAMIDGCGMFKTYLHVYMPLLKIITSTILIIKGVYIWNDLLVPLLTITTGKMVTLPLKLYSFVSARSTRWDYLFGATMLASVPIIVLFLIMQESFIKGMTTGAIKG
jgi:raffinose/stachyose/melibiose transport system permease protein